MCIKVNRRGYLSHLYFFTVTVVYAFFFAFSAIENENSLEIFWKMYLLRIAFILTLFGASKSWDNNTSRMYGMKYHEEYEPYQVTAVAEHEFADGYYTRIRPEKGIDLTNLGVLALLKLLFLKAKGLGFGLLLLIKLPIILFLFFGKIMILMKAFKFMKMLAMPLMFLAALPMLLGPLLLLAPFLVPLLLALPVPVLTATTTVAPTTGRKKRSPGNKIDYIKQILESENCIERIACRLGQPQSLVYKSIITWALEKIVTYFKQPKIYSYLEAYKTSDSTGENCLQKYKCTNKHFNLV